MRTRKPEPTIGDKITDAFIYVFTYGSMGCGIYVILGMIWTSLRGLL